MVKKKHKRLSPKIFEWNFSQNWKNSAYIYNEGHFENLSVEKFKLRILPIRQDYYKRGHDAAYENLTHTYDLQEYTIYNGMISSQSAYLLKRFKLYKLKLHNEDAESSAAFKI